MKYLFKNAFPSDFRELMIKWNEIQNEIIKLLEGCQEEEEMFLKFDLLIFFAFQMN